MVRESSDRRRIEEQFVIDCINILDSGSATTLAGFQDAEEWVRKGFARKYTDPLPSAIRHIRGIGALNSVKYWLEFTLDIGGALVTFHDIPVLQGHRGLLLGNEFLGVGRASLKYLTDTTGVLKLHDKKGADVSLPIAFRTDLTNDGLAFVASQARKPRRRRRRAGATVQAAADVSASESEVDATDFGEITEAERVDRVQQQLGAAEIEKALEAVTPIAWAPETITVPAWSEVWFKVRVPETLVKARDVLLTPLEDERQKDLGVLISSTIQRVDDQGYVSCRAINLQKKAVRIPLLTPVARFQVDPRVYNVDYEYTVDEIVERVHLDKGLTDQELQAVKAMLEKRRALFRSKLGYAHGYKMKLRVPAVESGEKRPPNAQLRVRSTVEETALIDEVNKQWKAGLIEPARSPYNALPMLVKKPTKPGEPQQFRVVLDYRGVNSLLEKDVYPLPNLESNLSALGKANWFSTLDLLQGFHQVELEESSKEVTGFSTPIGQFQYVRMPMGLASSPSTFMRLVDATLRGLPPGIALAYVDDVVIPTCGTFEEHLRDVGQVFDRLIEAGFAVRCDKCHIGLKEVPYLGFMVGAYGTRPQTAKIQAVLDLTVQDMYANPAAAARYSGMLGFYSKFLPNLHTLLAPFHDLKGKAAPVDDILGGNGKVPSLRFLASFAATRSLLANTTALVRPDYTKAFFIHVDAASSCGIGAALMQLQDDTDPESFAPVAFMSRRLRDEERGYSVRDQECLALHEALKGWRHYILGCSTVLLSDHSSLQWLLTTPHADGSNVATWALYAQQFDLEIKWIPGKINVVSDFFSRSATSTEMGKEVGASGENQHMLFERLAASDSDPDPESLVPELESFATRNDDIETVAITSRVRACRLIQYSFRRYLAMCVRLSHVATARLTSVISRKAERVSVVFVRRSTSHTCVLVDRCDDGVGREYTTTFPSTLVDRQHENFTYREQARGLLRDTYRNEQLCSLLKDASAFRCRTGRAYTHFFVATLPTGIDIDGHFVPIDKKAPALFKDADDRAFLLLLARALVKPLGLASNHWVGSFDRVGRQLASLGDISAVTVCVAAWSTGPGSIPVPSILEKPCGPALCESTEHGDTAIEQICTRLRAHTGLCLSLDLEGKLGGRNGHIDLMQLAVASTTDEEEPLIFVFNTHLNKDFLSRGQLRVVLEDPLIPKVMHCSYGDASALYIEYGIQIRGGFDTGVADCILRGAGFNKQRRLDTVIADHLADRTFTHKSSIVHVPGMFQHRCGQLPYHLFVYAYEDVLHCCDLYVAMKEALAEAGLLELSNALSAMRAPPRSLSRSDVGCQHPEKLAIVFRDKFSMVCTQDQNGLCSIPQATFDSTQLDYRAQALAVWSCVMGKPPKPLSGTFTNRMRKAIWLADTMLIEIVVDDCKKFLPSLRTTKELLGDKGAIVLRPLYNAAGPSVGTAEDQLVPLQYLHWSACGEVVPGLANSVDANVVVGKVNSPLRAAVMVYDDDTVYTLTTASGSLAFPSAPIEIGADPREAAFKAFDTFAGPSLRKHDSNVVGNSVMPVSARRVRTGFNDMKEIATVGNVIFYGCYISGLSELSSAFYAARNVHTGYRLTVTLAKRHPNFSLCTHKEARSRLDKFDLEAFGIVQPSPVTVGVAATTDGAVSQHSGDREQDRVDVAWYEQDMLQSATQTDDALTGSAEDESLFDAAVCIHYAELLSGSLASADSAMGVGTPGTIGTSTVAMPSIAELLEAQLQHPATGPWLDYLRKGELSTTWLEARTAEARVELERITENFCIDGDGLLCRRPQPKRKALYNSQDYEQGLMIIVPPALQQRVIHQYHDKQGHFGVDKTLGLIRTRFYWGGTDVMRNAVSEYIKACDPCQLSKVPGHQAGEHQIPFNGHHPGDSVCGDVFYVGFEEDGYDHTLDFADLFSRGVRSDAMKGMPDSETIMDAMLQGIIRLDGVPSEVRSDAGSNFISKAVRLLYKRMSISITVGTAYRHQLVALVERWHRTLLQLIRVHRAATSKANWSSKWYRCLPLMELAYNITVNNSTGFSPFFIRHLRHARAPVDLQRTRIADLPKGLASWVQGRLDDLNVVYDAASEELRVNALSAKRRYDLRRDVSLWFKPGDRVLLVKGTAFDKSAVHPKASLPMAGPFTVMKALPFDRYLLTDLKTLRIRNSVHISRLAPYFGRVDANDSKWKLTTDDSGGLWPVQGLVGRRVTTLEKPCHELGLIAGDRVLEYRVRWTGFDRNSDKWRPLQALGEIMELVNEYDSRDARPAEFTEPLEHVARPDAERPTVAPEALRIPHFRSHPHPGEHRPPVDDNLGEEVAKKVQRDTPLQDSQKQLADSLQHFPVGARVRVHYPVDGQSWVGTIVKSWIPRWRTADKRLAHHVTVRYDDPAFKGRLYEHDVQQSIIEIERTETERTKRTMENTDDNITVDDDDKLRKRLQRLKRQLG